MAPDRNFPLSDKRRHCDYPVSISCDRQHLQMALGTAGLRVQILVYCLPVHHDV